MVFFSCPLTLALNTQLSIAKAVKFESVNDIGFGDNIIQGSNKVIRALDNKYK